MGNYRYVWYIENSGPAQEAKVNDWTNSEWISRLQLADGTHRSSIPFYQDTTEPIVENTYAYYSQPMPDGDVLEEAIKKSLGRDGGVEPSDNGGDDGA
jgi:hypothetical protein